ncbi:hypothetical protein M0802_002283 [Mischocyttarus mexicanus]|nr:hypothetical protein M0802_002283 [Mischocyttarus mexicanus]
MAERGVRWCFVHALTRSSPRWPTKCNLKLQESTLAHPTIYHARTHDDVDEDEDVDKDGKEDDHEEVNDNLE